MGKSLKSVFLSGTMWTAAENVIFTVLGIVQLAITSRILSSTDFGVYAIAVFFTGLGTIAFSMGLGPALVQKKGDIKDYLDTAWSANLLASIVATIVLEFLIFPICTYYYHNEEGVLPSMVIMLSVIFSAGQNPAIAYFQKEIKLKKYFYLKVFPKILSFVLVVVSVYYMKSYWGLIIALLSEYLFRLIYSFFVYPYKVKFVIDKDKFYELYRFGGWLQLKNITSWFATNIDVAIVGNVLGTASLGLYNRAQTIAGYPRTFVTGVIDNVAFPLYAQITDDKSRVDHVLSQIQNIVMYLLSMMCIVVVLYAKPIVLLVLGSTWVEMVEPFKIIFVSYVLQTLLFSFNPLLRAYGFTKQEFRFYTIKMLVMIGLLYPLTYWYGLIGAGISILLAVICVFPYLFYTIKKLTHVELRQIFYSFGISLFVSFITVGVFMYIPDFDGFWWVLEMFIAITFASFFYFLLALILKKGPGLAILSLTHLKK